jgi:redox-sensitive bicupin YhaK (pirin superfamily)
MLTIRPASERGHADHGWLDSHHTFSFASYYDPQHMGFRSLRVINDDRVAPGEGFGTHPHRDMEIISYVLEGALEHRDSMGTGSVLRAEDVQKLSAGTGITHSEFNPSPSEPVHFLQIWLTPSKTGLKPNYEQTTFTSADKQGRLRVIASPDGRDGSVTIHSDAVVHAGVFTHGQSAELMLAAGRHAWAHVARGKVRINGRELQEGDGAAISDETVVRVDGVDHGEVLVFDLG